MLLASFSAVMLIAGMMTAFNTLSPKIALAAPSPTSETANQFGQSASQPAQGTLGCPGGLCGVQMGQHSQAGGAAGKPPFDQNDGQPGRNGLGNVGNNVLAQYCLKL